MEAGNTVPLRPQAPTARIAGEPAWLPGHRGRAMARFNELGMPRRSEEAWRFTDLRPLTETPFAPADAETPAPAVTADAYLLGRPTHRLVLVNGRFSSGLSDIGMLPAGAWIGSMADALAWRPDLVQTAAFDDGDTQGSQAFVSLNAGLFTDGFVLALEPGVVLDLPLEVVHLAEAADGVACHLRNAIVLGAGARATVVETAAGSGAGWTNMVTRVDLALGAELRHVKIQREDPAACHLSLLRASLAGGARYDNFTATLGARLSRQDMLIDLNGEGAGLALHSAYLLRGDQEATFVPSVRHRARNCVTREVFKGAVGDWAHGVFLGSVHVGPGADGTQAHQLNRNLVLGPDARVDTKPELEIFADDVKCSHGATVGDLDETAMFYLLSRGIDPVSARRLLIEAFVADVVEGAALEEGLAAHVNAQLAAWFAAEETAP